MIKAIISGIAELLGVARRLLDHFAKLDQRKRGRLEAAHEALDADLEAARRAADEGRRVDDAGADAARDELRRRAAGERE